MVGIITGTICPPKGIQNTQLINPEERMEAYENCLRFYIKSGAFKDIVFCDNSNTALKNKKELMDLAYQYHVRLELWHFAGNQENVLDLGKGYGEGEIMRFLLGNSMLVRKDTYMVKITGRLIVDNIKRITKRLKETRIYFNVPNHVTRTMYDTRLYAMPIGAYELYFQNQFLSVDDSEGYYLECAYTDVIRNKKLQIYNFPVYPRITGISGSSGQVYSYTEWKSKIKDILSKFQFYSKLK